MNEFIIGLFFFEIEVKFKSVGYILFLKLYLSI